MDHIDGCERRRWQQLLLMDACDRFGSNSYQLWMRMTVATATPDANDDGSGKRRRQWQLQYDSSNLVGHRRVAVVIGLAKI
jgi:hypothetical protein